MTYVIPHCCWGVIREVAEQRVGGSHSLDKCVNRGSVLEVEEDREMMYYFKEKYIGEEESFSGGQTLKRQKHTTEQVFNETMDFVKNLGWAIKTTQKDMEAMHLDIHLLGHVYLAPDVHIHVHPDVHIYPDVHVRAHDEVSYMHIVMVHDA